MDQKRIQCLSNTSQHVHKCHLSSTIYELQQDIDRKSQLFPTPLHLTPPYGVAPGTIAINVTRLERGFSACKTPRCIYPSIFNRFPVIQAGSLKVRHFCTFLHILASPVYLWENRGKCLHGSKYNSMLVKCLAACTHLASTVSEI